MTGRNNAGPVPTNTVSDDRLGLLPKELLDIIHFLVFHSENGSWTLNVKANLRPPWHARESDILSILALPQD